MSKPTFQPKSPQTDFARNLLPVITMTEELTVVGCQPFAVLGFHFTPEGAASHLATISNDRQTEEMIIGALKGLLESKGYSVSSPSMIVKP